MSTTAEVCAVCGETTLPNYTYCPACKVPLDEPMTLGEVIKVLESNGGVLTVDGHLIKYVGTYDPTKESQK